MTESSASEKRSPTTIRVLTVLGVGAFATGTDSFVIAGLLAEVAAELGTSVGAVGLTVSVFALTYAVAAPVLVSLTARLPVRRVLVGAMAVFVVANLLAAAAPDIVFLGAARVLAALAAGMFMPMAITTAAALGGEQRRARSAAVVVGGASLALVLGVPLGTLAGQLTTWRGAFCLVALLGLLAAAGMSVLVPDLAPVRVPGWRARFAVLRRGEALGVLTVTLLANTAAFSVYPYLGPLFPAAGSSGVALLVLGFGVGAIAGTWLGARAADAFGARRVVAVLVALFALNHFALGVVDGVLVLGVGYAVFWGLTGWAMVPAQQSRLISLTGPAASVALSVNSSATHLGTGLGAGMGAVAISLAGPGWIWLGAGLFALAALLVVLLVPLNQETTSA